MLWFEFFLLDFFPFFPIFSNINHNFIQFYFTLIFWNTVLSLVLSSFSSCLVETMCANDSLAVTEHNVSPLYACMHEGMCVCENHRHV